MARKTKKSVDEMTEEELHSHLYYSNGKLKRRRITEEERHKPCLWCGYPFSQRHHLYPIHSYGETDSVINLCANCHELYHITEKARQGNVAAFKLLLRFALKFGLGDARLKNAADACQLVEDAEKQHKEEKHNEI